MRLLTTRLDVEYDRPFRRPMFKVSRSAVEILECFYDALSSEYPLAMSDLSAAPAISMGDVAIRVKLFHGNGFLEVGAEKFTARFDGLQSKTDVDVVKTVIRLSENALERGLPGTEYKWAAIRTATWSACEDGERAVQVLLDKYGANKGNIFPQNLGKGNTKSSIGGSFTSSNEGWMSSFLMEISEITNFNFFFKCDNTYFEGEKFVHFDERVEHFEIVYRSLLEHYGIEANSTNLDA